MTVICQEAGGGASLAHRSPALGSTSLTVVSRVVSILRSQGVASVCTMGWQALPSPPLPSELPQLGGCWERGSWGGRLGPCGVGPPGKGRTPCREKRRHLESLAGGVRGEGPCGWTRPRAPKHGGDIGRGLSYRPPPRALPDRSILRPRSFLVNTGKSEIK